LIYLIKQKPKHPSDCQTCKFDGSGNLKFCEDHIFLVECLQCGNGYFLEYQSDVNDLHRTGDTLCIPCHATNRIEQLEIESVEGKKETEKEIEDRKAMEWLDNFVVSCYDEDDI